MTNSNGNKPSGAGALVRKVVNFAGIGVINTAIDMLVYFGLSFVMSGMLFVAQIISYTCGAVNSFFMNRYFTFKKHEAFDWHEMLRFVIVNLAVIGVTALLTWIFADNIGIHGLLVKLGVTAVSQVMNFLAYYFWVFAGEKK